MIDGICNIARRLLFVITFLAMPIACAGSELHVAVDGSDTLGDGSLLAPYASPVHVRDLLRMMPEVRTNGVTVWFHGGTYRLHEPLALMIAIRGERGTPWNMPPGRKMMFSLAAGFR